jgi:hypothetical protein
VKRRMQLSTPRADDKDLRGRQVSSPWYHLALAKVMEQHFSDFGSSGILSTQVLTGRQIPNWVGEFFLAGSLGVRNCPPVSQNRAACH